LVDDLLDECPDVELSGYIKQPERANFRDDAK